MSTDVQQKAAPIVTPLIYDTYLAAIKNSIESRLFRNLYAKVDGERTDITQNGNLSCAFFASSLLFLFKLIRDIHATVSGTIRDLKESGWVEIESPIPGCVLVWEEADFGNGSIHKHIGFYLGEDKAISNNTNSGYPTEHPWSNFKGRKVELILWNPKLED